jgi:hypothetical protein
VCSTGRSRRSCAAVTPPPHNNRESRRLIPAVGASFGRRLNCFSSSSVANRSRYCVLFSRRSNRTLEVPTAEKTTEAESVGRSRTAR